MSRPSTPAAAARAASVLLAAGTLAGCASDHSIGVHDADAVLGMTLAEAAAEVHEGVHVVPVDLGYRYLDPPPPQPRPADPPEGWRVVAQCRETLDGALTVGVLAEEEYRSVTRDGLAAGFFLNPDRIFLDCPEDRDGGS